MLEDIVREIPDLVVLGTALIAVANIITAITPTNHDNILLATILKTLNIASGNVFKNKNKDDK